jgi:hypothetical protein
VEDAKGLTGLGPDETLSRLKTSCGAGSGAVFGNAVSNAIGCPINELPITPEKILRAIKAKGNALAE